MALRVITKDDISRVLDYPTLIQYLREAFAATAAITAPMRHHHTIPAASDDQPDATLLLMPAWTSPSGVPGSFIGLKTVAVFPANASRGLPAVSGSYLFMSADTGQPLAVMDGTALTVWRTAAASALAASYLARSDARTLVMVGAGSLAPHLVRAHLAVRPSLCRILIWNRSHDRAAELAARLGQELGPTGIGVASTTDLEGAVRGADIISCATLSKEPLVLGSWLAPGAHLDLVGAYRPDMRECDDQAVRRARIFVDTREGALSEAGDLVGPIMRGVITPLDVCASLADLAAGAHHGRSKASEITLFKSVGSAFEDLACARLVWERVTGGWDRSPVR